MAARHLSLQSLLSRARPTSRQASRLPALIRNNNNNNNHTYVDNITNATIITVLSSRSYHHTPMLSRDEENRSELKPWPREGTQSGYDADVAAHVSAAFNPKETKPEESKESFQRESNGSPLEFSGANKEFSSTHPERTMSDKTDHPDKMTRSKASKGTKHGILGAKKPQQAGGVVSKE